MASVPTFTTRPVYMGRHGVIASGHYLAARAGQLMFDKGGNAIDATIASGLALCVLEPQSCGIGGEVPILVRTAKDGKVHAISGQGCSGQNYTIEWFRKANINVIPGDGFLPATVPATFGTFAFTLMHFGTRSLKEVLEPAIEYTESGFPVYPTMALAIGRNATRFRDEWPGSAALYLPNNRVPEIGEVLRNPDWANTLKRVVDVEQRERKRGREAAIQAAIDYWYKGDVAERIVEYMQKTEILDASKRRNRGLLTKDDFAYWRPKIDEHVSVRYRGIDVYKCGPWTQGPVFLQQLRLLEGFDLKRLGQNSANYLHILIEVAKLAFADRERFYGDPDFVKVPMKLLLSPQYSEERRKLIDVKKASMQLRPGHGPATDPPEVRGLPRTFRGDTTHTCAIDEHGNMMAATPSGGWFPSSPVIPGLGFPMGTRGQLFYLDPHHANALLPRKRPRTTLTPSLALKDGHPYMVFGTPGGDQQDQWLIQFFVNYVDFEMNLQEAIDRPTVHSAHFPSSFYPHEAQPGRMVVESRISQETRRDLEARGHKIQVAGEWDHGRVTAVYFDRKHSVLQGAVSPRRETGYVSGS